MFGIYIQIPTHWFPSEEAPECNLQISNSTSVSRCYMIAWSADVHTSHRSHHGARGVLQAETHAPDYILKRYVWLTSCEKMARGTFRPPRHKLHCSTDSARLQGALLLSENLAVRHMQAVVYTHAHENDGPNSFNGSKLIAHNSKKESKEWTNFLAKRARYSSAQTEKIYVGLWNAKSSSGRK